MTYLPRDARRGANFLRQTHPHGMTRNSP